MTKVVAVLLALAALTACSPQVQPGWGGYMEGEYVYVAPIVAGTLSSLPVREGQQVAIGDTLFALESVSEHAAREEALARLEAVRAQAANIGKGSRADEIAVIEAKYAQARAKARVAEQEYKRQRELVAKGFVSAGRLDELQGAQTESRARVKELDASLRVARLPARQDEQAAAVAQVQAAEQALLQSDWREAQMSRRAPAAGRVAQTFFQVGELVPAGRPVLSVLPTGKVKARFFVPEPALAELTIGQLVAVHCDGCAVPVNARLDYIAPEAEYTPPVIYSNTQRAKLVFRVEARPEPGGGGQLKPGLPIEVFPIESTR